MALFLNVMDVLAAVLLTALGAALVRVLVEDLPFTGFNSGQWLAVAVLFAVIYSVLALMTREHKGAK